MKTLREATRPQETEYSARVKTDPGLAGEMQRLLIEHPTCPEQADAITKFVYANASALISALRLAEI